ncbi:hypothetical protein DI005_03475 [Prauserella sp. PE36]|uniref:hypothetical protein n=1 Tax=Prauserella sp. PE36 TaxID=1504709 RepID=UPI000DE43E8D|nr:hypothetical protein [Prauserella sp. PE36]RBM23038.1 hypothetical protein DI005_03475 [Prauserella sp. PE36]
MDWGAYVDGYCERLGPGLWGEPLNTVSNLAFLAAAVAVWRQARGATGPRVLAVLLGLIFLASTAFHALATRWAGAADTFFILVFVLAYTVVFTHVFLGVRWARAWLAAPVFLAFTVVVTAALAPLDFDGASYVAPLLGLFGLAALLATARSRRVRRYWPRFALTGGLFGVSLSLRSADHSVCGGFPPGTHFLWHLLNAVVLYVVSLAALREWAPRPLPSRAQ